MWSLREGQKYVEVTCEIWQEGEQYVSRCRELEVASCGDTFEEAVRNLQEAVETDLNALEELGERPRFFRERGLRLKTFVAPKRDVAVTRPIRRDRWTSTERVPVTA